MSEQSTPASAGGRARHEEDENTALGPKSNTDPVTMADAGLAGGGATTASPTTSPTETVPGEERVGHENDDLGE